MHRPGLPDGQGRGTPRLNFANQLRGLAALSVVFAHLIGVFWLMQEYLQSTTLAPAQGGAIPGLVTATTVEWFQPGPFGVGLFFLISGLVVPISLEKHSAASFIVARVLRIYPTYMAGLGVQMLALLASSQVWGRPVPYGWKVILANAFLVHDLTGLPSIDLVNWTLTTELRFYALVALLAPWFRTGRLGAVFGPSVAACMLALLISQGVIGTFALDTSTTTYTVSSELPFLILMLMGVLFNYHLQRHVGTAVLVGGLIALAAMMTFAWWFSVLRGQLTHVLINDAYALALFAALYAVRAHVAANRVLDALAAISYPLYLVHSTLGYLVMKTLMLLAGFGYLPALAAALLVVAAVATVLHVTVEKPSIGWGRRLAARPKTQAASPVLQRQL